MICVGLGIWAMADVGRIHAGAVLVFGVGAVLVVVAFFTNRKLILFRDIFFLIALSIFILLSIPILRGFKSNNPIQSDSMIILGGGVRPDETPSASLEYRLRREIFLYFRESNKFEAIYVTGGVERGMNISEGEIMKRYLVKNGIPSELIFTEDKSTSTVENILFLREKYPVLREKESVLLVSNDFHLGRARYLAKKKGFERVEIAGTHTPRSQIFPAWIREMLAWINSVLFQ